jgi:hypothetical protein
MSEQGTQTSAQAQKPRAIDKIAGTFENVEAINTRLKWAIENAHLVSPVTAVSRLPEGVGVALSMELLNVERDTYGLPGGKRSILKPALERIGRAAGVKWDPEQCYSRVVGPFHVVSRAVGHVMDLSFQSAPIIGEVDMDYGPGSIGEEKVRADAKDKSSADKTLREIRHFLLRHAESRSYLRAIRRLGIATSYTPAELAKPFIALQLTWTGRSSDPETQRELTRMTAERMLGATSALYGKREERTPEVTTRVPAAPPAIDATPRLAAQRAESLGDFLDYDEDTGEVRQPVSAPRQQAAPAQQRTTPAPRSNGGGGASRSGPVFRFGRNKDKAFSDASLDDLDYYRAKIEEGANDPEKERFRADALLHLAEIDRAIAASRGEVAEPPPDDGDPGPSDDRF